MPPVRSFCRRTNPTSPRAFTRSCTHRYKMARVFTDDGTRPTTSGHDVIITRRQCLWVMSTSKWPLQVSEERVQMYRARRTQYLSAAITDGDHEPEVDPYAFEEGDVKFTFSNKKDKAGGEREP
ncbi:mediator of RNA polymerase II transcription subunit 13 [Lates japonicus]|uniref:Mediator of RNA polymerase II transcription subunit 13 n=1 Tax=Lates japonicus TaxID=270547 RepID=A0AAD3NI49_LATJO|nr:mediator of RNA polymerase II transcription subunit 13 [Lates japonicus]